MGGERYASAALSLGKQPVTTVRKLGALRFRSGCGRKSRPHRGSYPSPNQLLASRSTVYVMPVDP
jgi:hypothetical protein